MQRHLSGFIARRIAEHTYAGESAAAYMTDMVFMRIFLFFSGQCM